MVVGDGDSDYDYDSCDDQEWDEESSGPRLFWLLVFGGRDHHRGFLAGRVRGRGHRCLRRIGLSGIGLGTERGGGTCQEQQDGKCETNGAFDPCHDA